MNEAKKYSQSLLTELESETWKGATDIDLNKIVAAHLQSFADKQVKKALEVMVEKSKNYSTNPLRPNQKDFYEGAKWMKEELEKTLNQQDNE